MTNQEKKDLVERYLEETQLFNKTTPEEADQMLEDKAGHIVYIGFESCPYSQKFVHKLSALTEEHDLEINYLYSKKESDELDAFREKYDIPTVPGFLYSSEEAGLTVKCDSSLTPDEILEIVEMN